MPTRSGADVRYGSAFSVAMFEDSFYTAEMPVVVGAVASDRIIILLFKNMYYSRCDMYQILLGEDELSMEFCVELK